MYGEQKYFFFFSSRRRHTRCSRDWSSDVCSSDLKAKRAPRVRRLLVKPSLPRNGSWTRARTLARSWPDRKSTRLNSSHGYISYAVFCLKKKKKKHKHKCT